MIRTRTESVTFKRSFRLSKLGLLPPGTYTVEIDEELLEGASFPLFRRVRTLFHLPADIGQPGPAQAAVIDPHDVAAALESDAVGEWQPVAHADLLNDSAR